ncbi:hypothetical protein GO986_20980 [Deinococcus sp. HMF7620]|uniref:Uncharacterized protein n=1 Tax=Deinococcus arboris TaxID=2682977 RepID=A0A7C9HUA0_9DEIO|nr:hypothetical protein [Deinococcus arboris]MVN89213.1 hypothetical protein [Deinococcus arboris]
MSLEQSSRQNAGWWRASLFLALLAMGTAGAQLSPSASGATPPGSPLSPLRGLHTFMTTFTPPAAEGSLLALAQREGLTWGATQNLFARRLTDEAATFLDWRGHSHGGAGSVFTTVRAATYRSGTQALLVLNRQWCAQGACQERSAFAWLRPGGTLTPTGEHDVIPLLRDQEFLTGSVPPCLRAVTLGVSYLPAPGGLHLHALPLLPPDAARACTAARVNLAAVTRPLRLVWHAASGKFKKG